MVTKENYEEYMMLDADGELDSAGKLALQAFIKGNPVLEAEYAAWQGLKLQPEPSLTFPGKEALLKRKGVVLSWKPYTLAAAAAILVAIVVVPALWKSDRQYAQIVHTFPAKATTDPVIVDQSLKANPVTRVPSAAQEKEDQRRKQEHVAKSEVLNLQGSQRLRVSESIAALDIASKELVVQRFAVAPQTVGREVALTVVEPEEPHQQSAGLPRIQLAQENRQALDLLKRAVEERVAQASSVARSVKETAFVIKLGNGVNINF